MKGGSYRPTSQETLHLSQYSSSEPSVAVMEPVVKGNRSVSMPIAITALCVFLVSIVSVGLIVHFTSQRACQCNCLGVTGKPTTPDITPPKTTPRPTNPPLVKDVRLPNSTEPISYDLVLAPNMYIDDPKNFVFKGKVDIHIKCISATKNIKIHSFNQTVDTAKVKVVSQSGADVKVNKIEYDSVRQWFNIDLDESLQAGGKYTIKIPTFESMLMDDLRGLYYSSYRENGTTHYLATSQLQPTDARKTFPCYDEPAIKAVFNVRLVHRDDFTPIANMPVSQSKAIQASDWDLPAVGNFRETSFKPTPIMSTYLLAFVVSQFKYLETNDTQGRLYRNWGRPELYNDTLYGLGAVVNMTNYFESYFNVSYPLNKTDQIAVPDFNAGAMENWGLIIYRESRLLFNPMKDTVSAKQAIGSVIAHELAHQWFGNLVTPTWWDDIWLNEGFATFVTSLAVEDYHPEWDIDAQFVVSNLRMAYEIDSKGSSHPIYQEVYNPSQINQIFDLITYRKGASVLRMMYYFLGDKVFREGIGAYLKKNEYSSTNHRELYATLTEYYKKITGKDLDVASVMNTWVLQMGYPVVECTVKSENVLELTQKHFLSDKDQVPDPDFPTPYNYTWRIPITHATLDKYAANFNNLSNVFWFSKKTESLELPGMIDKGYILNLRSAGFYRVNYDGANWQKLIRQLNEDHTVFKPHDRARLIDDAFNLAKAGQLDYNVPLDLSKYLKKENDYVPWQSAISNFDYFHSMLNLQNSLYGTFSKYMRDILTPAYDKLGIQHQQNDTHLDKRLRTLIVQSACLFGVRSCETEATKLFSEWLKNDTTPINPDIRSRVFCEGIASNFVAVWDQMFDKLAEETNPDMINDIQSALACSYEPWILQRYLEYAIANINIKRQDMSRVFAGIASNPNGMLIVWEFLQNNWEKILEGNSGAFTTGYFIRTLRRFNTEQKRREMEEFKENHDLGSAKQTMDQTIDEVKININWMTSYLGTIKEWLDANSVLEPLEMWDL